MSSFSAKLEEPVSIFSSGFRVLVCDCVKISNNPLSIGEKGVSLADPVCMWLGRGLHGPQMEKVKARKEGCTLSGDPGYKRGWWCQRKFSSPNSERQAVSVLYSSEEHNTPGRKTGSLTEPLCFSTWPSIALSEHLPYAKH